MSDEVGTIYLLHFTPPVRHAIHYVGWTRGDDPAPRVSQHLARQGSPLVAAAVRAGCSIELVLTRPGTRRDERALKDRKNARALCPLCLPFLRVEAAERMRRIRARRRERKAAAERWAEGAAR